MRGRFLRKITIPSNISTYLTRTLIIITVAATFLTGGILIFQQTRYFDKFSEQKHNDYIENEKNYIQEIVKNEIQYIEIQNEEFKEKTNSKIKQNVNQALATAEAIYSAYAGKKSEEEIKSLIVTTISSLNFEMESEGIFITTLQGIGVFYNKNPEFTGKDMLKFKDSNGFPVVKRELELLKTKNEGFLDYTLKSSIENENISNQKICFVKKFGHFDWYFGSKHYLNDYFPAFRDEIAQKISSVRFRNGGYIFMNNMNGNPIVMDGKVYKGTLNLLSDSADSRYKVFKQELDLLKTNPEGGYIYYQWNKIGQNNPSEKCSYVQLFKQYNWIIGAGFYLDEVEQGIVEQQKALKKDQEKSIYILLSLFILLLILEATIIYHFNKRYKADFERFFNFFFSFHENQNKLDTSGFYFDEFKSAGVAANAMMEQRLQIERRLIQEQEKATESDRLKSSFLANMSHEIRTPMNAILGFSELLDDESQEIQDKKLFVKLIKKNGEMLLHLINDIIDISKIESNLLSIKKRPVDLVNFLEELEIHFKETIASKKEKEIEFTISKTLPAEVTILTDIIRLRQILENLIGNAIKFTATGKIDVNVWMNGTDIHFSVSDTGIGIPLSQQETIFERFMQADFGTKTYYGGNGLGLAISKNLIELLNGSINVESEPGKGSTFTFHISSN